LCRNLVDEYDLPDEDEIAAAMRLTFEAERLVIEGSAGVAIATAIRRKERLRGLDVAIVVCGGNIGLDTWCQVMGAGAVPAPLVTR
jgi:threonine dehydratase